MVLSGQTPIKQRLEEIECAVASGATEIDIVISRAFVLEANWKALYDEVMAMRKACREAHLKTIIATGTAVLSCHVHICGKSGDLMYCGYSRIVILNR